MRMFIVLRILLDDPSNDATRVVAIARSTRNGALTANQMQLTHPPL